MVNNVDLILITIYTGLRPTELLEITTDNVHLNEQYMIGGMKTEAGTDRVIPIADKILPLVKNRYDANRRFLVNNKYGNHYTYGSYVSANFNTVMNKLNMKHLPHDGRHTFASLMDDAGANEVCIKLIMGHSMRNNVTKGVYTHKPHSNLLMKSTKFKGGHASLLLYKYSKTVPKAQYIMRILCKIVCILCVYYKYIASILLSDFYSNLRTPTVKYAQ